MTITFESSYEHLHQTIYQRAIINIKPTFPNSRVPNVRTPLITTNENSWDVSGVTFNTIDSLVAAAAIVGTIYYAATVGAAMIPAAVISALLVYIK